MLNLVEISLNNNYVYIGVISFLVIVIILTIISIKKDRDKEMNITVTDEISEEEKEKAKLELEKVVTEMEKNIKEEKEVKREENIKVYEQEQEENAIISYQELVDAVKKNNNEPRTDSGMQVADAKFIEDPEEIIIREDLEPVEPSKKIDTEKLEVAKPRYEELKIERPQYEELKVEKPKYEELKVERPEAEEVSKPTTLKVEEKPKAYESYKKTEFISPVYGNNIDNIKEQEEFLDSLKDFRNHL